MTKRGWDHSFTFFMAAETIDFTASNVKYGVLFASTSMLTLQPHFQKG